MFLELDSLENLHLKQEIVQKILDALLGVIEEVESQKYVDFTPNPVSMRDIIIFYYLEHFHHYLLYLFIGHCLTSSY